jgi:hypothetical protein
MKMKMLLHIDSIVDNDLKMKMLEMLYLKEYKVGEDHFKINI